MVNVAFALIVIDPSELLTPDINAAKLLYAAKIATNAVYNMVEW